MGFHPTLVEELFSADVARETRRNRSVSLQVRHVRRFCAEIPAALLTSERFLTRMQTPVYPQAGCLPERPGAIRTRVRPFSGVSAQVSCQLRGPRQGAGAHGTRDRRGRRVLVDAAVMGQSRGVPEHLEERKTGLTLTEPLQVVHESARN